MVRRDAFASPLVAAFALAAFGLVALALLAPPAAGFGSLPGGPHDEITAAAVRESGFPEGAVHALVEAVRAVDLRDNALAPSADDLDRIDATADYRPEHHCDRVAPASDAEAFNATVAFIANRSEAAVAAAQTGEARSAAHLLGEVLHAVQDCFSHSNAVDLDDPQVMVLAVNGEGPAPEGLLLTGFEPDADEPESPADDPYPHGGFAKDSADKNEESGLQVGEGVTKFEAARGLATEASILALQKVLVQLDAEQLEALAEVDPGGQPLPRVGIPAVGWIAPVLAVVALAALRRRPRGP